MSKRIKPSAPAVAAPEQTVILRHVGHTSPHGGKAGGKTSSRHPIPAVLVVRSAEDHAKHLALVRAHEHQKHDAHQARIEVREQRKAAASARHDERAEANYKAFADNRAKAMKPSR